MAFDSLQATPKGWMPEATRVAIPASNFSVGNAGRKAAVLHIVEGSAASAISWFRNPTSRVSAHFVVTNSGTIYQCVSVLDTAHANGLSYRDGHWYDPEGNVVHPPWPGLTPPTNPNRTTISIEREGYYQERPTTAENAAVVRILQYLHTTFPTFLPSWSFMGTLIGHCHIAPKHRANCPGPHVEYIALAAAANGVAPAPPPDTKRYRARRIMISQRPEWGPPWAGELLPGEEVVIDKWYSHLTGHLADHRGFVKIADLEEL